MTTPAIHPAAMLFPMMDEASLKELAADIKANGQLEPVVIYDEMVLDGRNRLAACQLAGVEPKFKQANGDISSPVSYVLSKNLHRRQLTASQRAAVAAEMIPLMAEEARKRQAHGSTAPGRPGTLRTNWSEAIPVKGRAVDIAADAVGVGASSVTRALAVKRDDPETFEKIKRGEITANAAANGHKQQPQIGGAIRNKAVPFEISNERNRQRAESAKKKMIEGLAVVGGVCHGLENLDVGMVIAVCDAGEISTWAGKAEQHAREIRKFAARLRGSRDNGESE